jgi:hypothetical protein
VSGLVNGLMNGEGNGDGADGGTDRCGEEGSAGRDPALSAL